MGSVARMLRHRATLIAAVVAFAVMGLVSALTSRGDDPLDVISLQMAYTVERFEAVAQPWGPDGIRDFRRNLFLVDLAFPATYALLLVILFTRFAPGAPRWAVLAPVLALVADIAENSLHALALTRLLDGTAAPPWAVLGGSLFATAKYALLVAALVALARHAARRPVRVAALGVAALVVAAVALAV